MEGTGKKAGRCVGSVHGQQVKRDGGGGLTRGLSESRLRMRLVNTDKEPVKKRRWGSIPHERGGQVHLGQLCAGQTP